MVCLSVISMLIFQIVCLNITAISSIQKQQLADTLNRLLKFRPGWFNNINDRAKHHNAAGEIESFSGQDLYQFDLNEEFEKTVDRKYDMMVHLLGCVYTKVMLTFLNLLHVIILECRKTIIRSRNIAGNQVTNYNAKHRMHLPDIERALVFKDAVDYDNFKTVFDSALAYLENHLLMFHFMSTALDCLIGLAPLDKMQNELMQDLQRIKIDIDGITNLPAYMNVVCSDCSDDDKMYKRKMRILSDNVSKTIEQDIKKAAPLVKFKNNHCILPANGKIEQLKTEYRSDVINEEMKKLKNFVYDKQATASVLAPVDNQNGVDNNNVNNSGLVPNVTLP